MKHAVALAALLLTGCTEELSGAAYGQVRFEAAAVSTSPINTFSCATCHTLGASTERPAGGSLDGVVQRRGWWGGRESRLLDAMNVCVTEFMGGAPLTAESDDARALYLWLAQASPGGRVEPLPLTWVRDVTALSSLQGDASRGATVWKAACLTCHGAPHTGEGRLDARAGHVPEDSAKEFGSQTRAVVVEKVRHGKFFAIGGRMPPFASERLSDAEMADLLAYLGL